MQNKGEKEVVQKLLSTISKKYGPGALVRLDDSVQNTGSVEFIPTDVLTLDLALGGGMPRGRIIEIFGKEGGGKSMTAYLTIASAQRRGMLCALIDVEHTYSKEFGAKLGIKNDELFFSQPDYGEQALDIVDNIISTGTFGIVAVDSVAALVPKAELDGEVGDQHVAQQARMMSQFLRRITAAASNSKTIVIFINQVRDVISTMPVWGESTTTPGGRALKFYSSVRLKVTKAQTYKSTDKQAYGHRVIVDVVKNKVAPPLRRAEFDLIYSEYAGKVGIDKGALYLEVGTKLGIIKKDKNTYYAGETKLGTESDASVEILKMSELLDQIYKAALANPLTALASGE